MGVVPIEPPIFGMPAIGAYREHPFKKFREQLLRGERSGVP